MSNIDLLYKGKVGYILKNVIVYVDYENIHLILKKYYTNAQEKDLFNKIRNYCNENSLNILDIIVYANFDLNDLHLSHHQTWLLQHNVEVRHTSNKSKNYADIQIAVDVLEQVYTNEIVDGVVIISSDKDMIPLVKATRKRNKDVFLITTIKDYDYGVDVFPTKHEFLEKILDIKDETTGQPISEPIPKNIKDEIYSSFSSYARKNYSDFSAGKPYKHIELDFYIQDSSAWYKLFTYEFARYLKALEEENKLVVYQYNHYGKKCYGITIKELISELVNESIIQATDIQTSYINDEFIKSLYEKK